MVTRIIVFDDTEIATITKIELWNFDLDKLLVPNKISFVEKHCKFFIGCKNDYEVKSFCIVLPQTSGYVKLSDDRNK